MSIQFVKSVVFFVTSYFIFDPRQIEGGVGEHYIELYSTFIKRYSKMYKIFWFSAEENTLRQFDVNGNIASSMKISMPMAILKVLTEARKNSKSIPSFTAIIAYYYAAKDRPFSFLISLFLLRLIGILRRTNVIVDIIDPPVEVHVTYSESPSLRNTIVGTLLDILTLKKETFVLFCSNSYKEYFTRKYGIPYYRAYVIYHGSFPDLISAKPPKAKGPFTIFYSGSLLKVKGILELIESIGKLRKRGLEVTLMLTGGKLEMESKPWIKSIWLNDWSEWVKIIRDEADICVIPYPRRIHWRLVHHCKLPDYMAAGKPIVAMYGKETASILKRYKCGLVANDWDEFQKHIITLYQDREFARSLGNNGRKAVEQFFNCKNTAEMLNKLIQRHLKVAR